MTTAQLQHWAVLDLIQTLTADGFKIVAITNNPCHLWMRWTVIKPQKHIKLQVIRGVTAQRLIDQCFVVYEDNEQEEDGDTLTHTFIKEPWAVCETRFFYFWGNVNGVLTKSATALFKKHRVSDYALIIIETWEFDLNPPVMYHVIWEDWTYFIIPGDYSLKIKELWS
jgi:hypothetical protein